VFKARQLIVQDEKLRPLSKPEETTRLIEQFDLMPDRYKGSEVELIIQFSGRPDPVSPSYCSALNLPIGYSLSRRIKVLEPEDAQGHFFLFELYAKYDGYDFLLNSPDEQKYRIVCRLAFGNEVHVVEGSFPTSSILPKSIKDIETGEVFDNYIKHSFIKALIFVKEVGGGA
jgi:hypothetical protein